MMPIKVGFILLSNSKNPAPSTRIAVLNMFPFLKAENFEPHIVFEPEHATETPDVSGLALRLQAEGFDIVIFQKVHGPSVEKLAHQLRASGIRTIYCVCDLVNIAMVEATDSTIAVTDYLKSLYPIKLQPKIHVVHDGIEKPDVYKENWNGNQGSRSNPLRAVLVTSASLDHIPAIDRLPNWLEITIVGRYPATNQFLQQLHEIRWKIASKTKFFGQLSYLRFLASNNIKCIAWHPDKVYEIMQQVDIGIIPVETAHKKTSEQVIPSWKIKSENRLTMKMCFGLPVIATPIPAYEIVIKHGQNAFLAHSRQDWFKYLNILRDPEVRKTVGCQARESVIKQYAKEEQARRLIKALRETMSN
jgi:glycosyltransferase involved in cell wall biosynthesis